MMFNNDLQLSTKQKQTFDFFYYDNLNNSITQYKRKQFLGSLSHSQSSQALNDKWPTSIPSN